MFEKVKGILGFGCMRLQMKDGEIDKNEFCRMIDAFLDAGFNYFDTAHGYIESKSEPAIRECLVKRHDREDFVLANKLSEWFFKEESEILPLFENQLRCCGTDYFDVYLLHNINRDSYEKHKRCHSFEIVKRLKEQGKVRHMAISFHDTADVLDKILAEQPDIEAVQLQINYLDYDDPTIQSKACYDVAVKHGKKVIVMEPVKGGALVNLPKEAEEVIDRLGGGSYASYALRYAASYPEVFMVLSGMGNMEMMNDNIGTMKNFVPLSSEEFEATSQVRGIIRKHNMIQCTGCNYCTEICPGKIPVSEIFSVYNMLCEAKISREDTKNRLLAGNAGQDCIKCGKCEKTCPQGIKIRDVLEKIQSIVNG